MLGMVTTMDAAKTGMREIAEALGGGIQEGSLIIIEGEAKSGKSVMSQYIAYGLLSARGTSVAYYVVNNSPEELLANMASISLYASHEFDTDRFRIYELARGRIIRNARESLELLLNHIEDLPERFRLVVVDSVTPFMLRLKKTEGVDFFQSCKEMCNRSGRSILLVLDSHTFDSSMLARAHAMSDYYLKLRSNNTVLDTGQVDTRNMKSLTVTKLNGADKHGNEGLTFEIKPRVGIQILPLVRVKI